MNSNSEEGDLLLRVTGILPPADFHPFVIHAARELGLRGWVRHDAAGALVRAIGTEDQLVRLVRTIRNETPTSLRLRSMDPDLITSETPAAEMPFAALPEDNSWRAPIAEGAPEQTLAHVA